jgi:hypothetical protein
MFPVSCIHIRLTHFFCPCRESKNESSVLISGFRRDVDEICALLGYYEASCGNCLPTFLDNVSVPSSRVKSPRTPSRARVLGRPARSVVAVPTTLYKKKEIKKLIYEVHLIKTLYKCQVIFLHSIQSMKNNIQTQRTKSAELQLLRCLDQQWLRSELNNNREKLWIKMLQTEF